MAKLADLDFAGIVIEDGSTLCRTGPNALPAAGASVENPIVRPVLDSRIPVSGTLVLDSDFLIAENPYLARSGRASPSPSAMTPPFAAARKKSQAWSWRPRCPCSRATS